MSKKSNLKTYTVTHRATKKVWVFKYNIHGDLRSFEPLDGRINDELAMYMFGGMKFPYNEDRMGLFKKHLKKQFEIDVNELEYDFDLFWNEYAHKTRNKETKDYWKKMSVEDRVKAVKGVRKYKNFLRLNSWRSPVDPIRYLKREMFNDEF